VLARFIHERLKLAQCNLQYNTYAHPVYTLHLQVEEALKLLKDMRATAALPLPPPSAATLSTVVTACCKSGQHSAAAELLRSLTAHYSTAPATALELYNTAVEGCIRRGELRPAVALVRGMPAAGLAPDSATYKHVVGGCLRFGQGQVALDLLAEMEAGAESGAAADEFNSLRAAIQKSAALQH
jgi:pentatricopeptide repeat protein